MFLHLEHQLKIRKQPRQSQPEQAYEVGNSQLTVSSSMILLKMNDYFASSIVYPCSSSRSISNDATVKCSKLLFIKNMKYENKIRGCHKILESQSPPKLLGCF